VAAIPGVDVLVDPELLAIAEQMGNLSTATAAVAAGLHGLAWWGGRKDAGPKLAFDVGGVVLGLGGIAGAKLIPGVAPAVGRGALEQQRALINFIAGLRGVELSWPYLTQAG
jgi:hypothetical protein